MSFKDNCAIQSRFLQNNTHAYKYTRFGKTCVVRILSKNKTRETLFV